MPACRTFLPLDHPDVVASEIAAAELALADVIADTERLGLYDTDLGDVKAALKATRK